LPVKSLVESLAIWVIYFEIPAGQGFARCHSV